MGEGARAAGRMLPPRTHPQCSPPSVIPPQPRPRPVHSTRMCFFTSEHSCTSTAAFRGHLVILQVAQNAVTPLLKNYAASFYFNDFSNLLLWVKSYFGLLKKDLLSGEVWVWDWWDMWEKPDCEEATVQIASCSASWSSLWGTDLVSTGQEPMGMSVVLWVWALGWEVSCSESECLWQRWKLFSVPPDLSPKYSRFFFFFVGAF